jgi:hypothetical protein
VGAIELIIALKDVLTLWSEGTDLAEDLLVTNAPARPTCGGVIAGVERTVALLS